MTIARDVLDAGMIFASDSRHTTPALTDLRSPRCDVRRDGERVMSCSRRAPPITQKRSTSWSKRGRVGRRRAKTSGMDLEVDVGASPGRRAPRGKNRDGRTCAEQNPDSNATSSRAAQIPGEVARLFMFYSEGNYMKTTPAPAISRSAKASMAARCRCVRERKQSLVDATQ